MTLRLLSSKPFCYMLT